MNPIVEIKQAIHESDMVLIGIGELFQIKKNMGKSVFSEKWIEEYLQVDRNTKMTVKEQVEAYNALAKLLKNKNYFIVSLCTDDIIFLSTLDKEHIVTPCGSLHEMQCEEACTKECYPAEMFVQQVITNIENGEPVNRPLCKKCGAPLVFRTVKEKNYIEDFYMGQWEKYRKWLQMTLNRKICVLELGVGMSFPNVIRWPFEKMTFFNQKAKLYRVHPSLYQIAEELGTRGVSIEASPITLLRECD